MTTNLKKVEKIAKSFGTKENIAKELKRIQSIKCRLKKQKGKSSYQEEMTEILQQEQLLKEARQLLDPKKKHVTNYTQNDIDQLDYDQTVKAIRSIQSKKSLSRWLTDEEGQNPDFEQAVKIEQMLVEHRSKIKPVDTGHIRKTEVQTIIDTIENNTELSQDKLVELLKKLV